MHACNVPAGLPPDLEMHHIVVNSWDKGVDAEGAVVLISIPSGMHSALGWTWTAENAQCALHANMIQVLTVWHGAPVHSAQAPDC